MSHVITSVTVEIAAPAAFVWDVLTDFAQYPQWNPYTVAVAGWWVRPWSALRSRPRACGARRTAPTGVFLINDAVVPSGMS